MNSDEQRWNMTFRWIRNHRVSPHACRNESLGPRPISLPARHYATIGDGVGVTRVSVMGPNAGCGLLATISFEPGDLITAYHGELTWMPAVTAKASVTAESNHFKRISGSDFVIAGFTGRDIKFGSGGGSVANCASRKSDANARLVTLYERKHEDFMWCAETSRFERVNGTFLVATKHIPVNDEILTWYGKATRQRMGIDTVTVSEDVDQPSASDDVQWGTPEVVFSNAIGPHRCTVITPNVARNASLDKELMVAVYVWNRVLKTASGAYAYTAKAHFEDTKYRTEAEFLSQELDEFVEANTVSRLIGNPLMSDLCLRLCALWTLGNPGVEDARQWFLESPDANWGAGKVLKTIAIIQKAAGAEATTVPNYVDPHRRV